MQLHGPRTKKFLNFHAWQNLLKEQVCSETSALIGGNSPGVIAKTDHKSNSFMLELTALCWSNGRINTAGATAGVEF